MTIKGWFLKKEFTQGERYAITTSDEMILKKETEKAMLLNWKTDFGTISRWVPKSCIEGI